MVVVALLAVAVLSLRPASAVEGDEEDPIANPVAFAEASYAGVCAECHGGDGNGGVVPGSERLAPSLRDEGVTEAYMDLVLRTGRMPPPGDPFDNRAREVFYTDAEREAMVDWLVAEFGLERDIPTVEEGDVAVGLELFALNCAHCHGNTGAGGNAGQDAFTPTVTGLGPIAVAEAIRVGPFEMPAFNDETITPEEVNAITSYLEAVEEKGGTPLFGLVELNPVFASGFVAVFAAALIGSLLYIGGRPQPFEQVPVGDAMDHPDTTPIETEVAEPEGTTPMPDDDQEDPDG